METYYFPRKLLFCAAYSVFILGGLHASIPPSAGPSVDINAGLKEICASCASLGFATDRPVTGGPASSCKPIPPKNTESSSATMPMNEMLFDGLKKMDKQKTLLDPDGIFSDGEAIFVLGNTGSGKTTATQIIAGDLDRLHASFTQNGRKLVIIDDDDRIGAPTTKSGTLIPEYVIHPKSGLAFWDCPGFNHNRGLEADMAAMYFMKHALDTTTSAKFLLTVTHSSVQAGNERLDFDLLTTHVTRLLRNVTKLQPAIGLVVTKEGSYSSVSGEYRSDAEILLEIQEFLEKYVKTKKQEMGKGNDKTEKVELESKIKLVQGILGIGTGKNNLYFVRSPENCGVLGEMKSVRDTRIKLGEMIYNLEYIDVTPQDFRVTVKAETCLKLETEWIPENKERISKSISRAVIHIWTEFENTFYRQLEQTAEEGIKSLNHTTWVIGSFLQHTASTRNKTVEIGRYSEAESIYSQIYKLYKDLSFEVNCTESSILRQLEKQQHFFQLVTNQSGEILPAWTREFSIVYNELVKLQEFYQFCQKAKTNLALYSSQVILGNLMEQAKIPQFGSDEADVLTFLSSYNLTTVSSTMLPLWTEMGWSDRNYLTKILTETIPDISWKCTESMSRKNKMRLTIAGNYVKLSDVITTDKWPSYCNEENVAEISVVALEIVYLDADLNGAGREWHISIISPIWQVILGEGDIERKIILDGIQPVDPEKAADDGANYGDNGKHGTDGLPGGNAGSLFGVNSMINEAESLFVSANGGDGGRGQDGGNGHDETAAKNASYNDFSSGPRGLAEGYVKDGKLILPTEVSLRVWYTALGKNGSVGGSGGNGGNGGTSGNPGSIQIISENASQNTIRTKSNLGLPGVPGNAGSGGKGGKDGNHYSCLWIHMGMRRRWHDCYKSMINTSAPPGNDGTPGEYLKHSTVATVTTPTWRAILEYKTSFYEKTTQRNFLKLLDSHEEIQSTLKTVYFAKEIELLENKFYHIWNMPKKQATFLGYYDSLLDRLNSYSQSLNKSQVVDEEKYAISLLYAIVTGKIVGMSWAENRLNILDTEGYFMTLAAQLVPLKNEEQEKIISEETSRFKAALDTKVQEAEALIEHTVQPAIAEAQDELERLNGELLEELNQFLRESEVEVEKRKEAKRKFESLMWMRPLMGIFKTVGSLCSFLGPKGAAVGAVFNVGASVLGEFAPSVNPSNTRGRNIIPEAATQLYSIRSVNQAYYSNKIQDMQSQIDVVVKAAQNVNDNSMAAKMNSAAQNTQLSLDGFQLALTSPDGSVKEISLRKYEVAAEQNSQKMADTVTQVADAQEEMKKAGKQMRRNEENVRKFAIGLQAAQGLQGIATSIMDNNSELGKLEQLVKEAETNVQNLKKLKNKFYDDLFPEMDKMNQEIRTATDGLPGESQAALSVKKWKVKRFLKMVRGYLQQFTKGFKTNEKFHLSFDALDEAMALLIDMYDHIERYEEKKQLAGFIANVNSLSGNKNNIHDEELKLTLERLEFNVEANLFYQEYQRAMHAFKQWVFPFASSYLKSESPWGTEVSLNLTQVTQVYGKQIQKLEIELKRYKTTTVKGDEDLMLTNFASGVDSSKPFYVWTNPEWKDSIRKLLNGDVIHLKADVDMRRQDFHVQHFFFGKSAIKFKTIKMNIKTHNKSWQGDLDKKLKHFHMKMTHSGISVYKVMGQKYVMFDRNQSFEYSFERTAHGHVSKSMVNHKTDSKNADYLMSPYTWWTLQIVGASSTARYNDLAEFEDQVDLELVGEGIYLNQLKASRETLEKLDVSSYYDEVFEGEEFVPNNIFEDNTCASRE